MRDALSRDHIVDLTAGRTTRDDESARRTLAGVIFDLDGTLADTLPVAFGAFRHALSGFVERHYTDEELSALAGPSEDGIFRRLLPSAWEPAVERYLSEYARRHVECPAPFPGVVPLLSFLSKRRVPVGVATGKIGGAVSITLRELDLARYFDEVAPGSPDGDVKARCITTMVQRWRLNAGQVAYVGDSAADMIAARMAGVVAIGAGWRPRPDTDALHRHGAEAVFATVDEFGDWLRPRIR